MSMAPRFCPHAQAQAICEKKSSKKVQMSNFATKVLGASGLREHRRVERKVGKY